MVATVTIVFERTVHYVVTVEISDNDSMFLQAGGITLGSATTSSSTK
jgi:hypothetical protein